MLSVLDLQRDLPPLVPSILALAGKFPGGGAKDLDRHLSYAQVYPNRFLILVDQENGTLRGFLFAGVSSWDGERVAFIRGYAYAGRVPREVFVAGWQALRTWATEREIRSLIGFTQRPAAFVRKYQCQVVSAVVRRSLE